MLILRCFGLDYCKCPLAIGSSAVAESWEKVASELLRWQVRVIVCPTLKDPDHPMLMELSKFIQTSHITPAARDDEFPICVLGDVSKWYGTPREISTQRLNSAYQNWPRICGVTVKKPYEILPNTMKGIIALHGWGSDPRRNRAYSGTPHEKTREIHNR